MSILKRDLVGFINKEPLKKNFIHIIMMIGNHLKSISKGGKVNLKDLVFNLLKILNLRQNLKNSTVDPSVIFIYLKNLELLSLI